MKKIFSLIITLLLCIFPFTISFAAEGDRVLDKANLIEDSKEQLLREKIQTIANTYNFDVVILTVDSCEGKTPEAYADDAFDYGGYGLGDNRDGLLFLISMEDRDWHISTRGYGITAFTDYGIQVLGEKLVPDLSDGNYYEAFDKLLEEVPYYMEEAEGGRPVDTYNNEESGKSSFPFIAVVAISCGIGIVTASILRGQMNTAKHQKLANEYVNKDSFKITSRQDVYLYSNVTKTKKPTENDDNGGGSSVHTSSSGSSHGGGGGKF